ncbi:tyrosine-type recombinase/integrase [Bacillus sp. FJAT-45350]|uniref:tyrosine-type recombinase/integrase n=1 Tax=Bacillus sp. FJAT-45350 TaxID=2011014 RepID=UPI000BB78196|nr:tyrosine-type recombinase/integrase [Bacillus sp. FJAT-45350]
MELKLKINTINENYSINKIKKIDIQSFNENEYLQMFQQLVDLNIFACEFDDIHWKVFDKVQDMYVEFTFNIEVFTQLNKALKYFTILRLISEKKPLTVYNELQNLKRSILASNGLTNTSHLEVFLKNESLKSKPHGGRLASHLLYFLSFITIENELEIKEICDKHPLVKNESRNLPNFQDVIKFDDIVNDFFRNNDTQTIFEYLPIMMWWLLTNVLPLRPTEFLMLEKNCLRSTMRHNRQVYSIKVSRIKENPKDEDIEIDEHTYKILSKSISDIDYRVTNDSPYLFTTDLYYFSKERKLKRTKSNTRMNRRDFYDILNRFYKNVVKGIYQEFELEKIKFGDTRHFAIINMCLQGFNMLSIAKMAGHKDIYTQDNYFSHASQFAQSYVYSLAQKKLEHSITTNTNNGIIGWKRFVYDKGKVLSTSNLDQNKIVGRIQYGSCTESKDIFPSNCIEDCRFCNKFLFNPTISEYEEGIKWLGDCSQTIKVKISESIQLMREIASKGNGNTYNNFSSENLLKTTSRKLTSLMDMKATLDAKIMEATNEQKGKD